MSVSCAAVLCVRNEEAHLRRAIGDFVDQGIDVAIIDHGSTDRTREICAEFMGNGLLLVEHMPWTGVYDLTGQLQASPPALTIMIDFDEQPVTWTPSAVLANAGWQSLRYTATVDGSASVVPGLSGATAGTLSPTQEALLQLSMPGFSRTLGTYTGTVRVNWYAAGAGNNPRSVGLQMIVVSDVYRTYLPSIMR